MFLRGIAKTFKPVSQTQIFANKAMFSTAAQSIVQGTAGRSLSSRAGIFRALLVVGGAHIAVTYGSSMLQEKEVMMSVGSTKVQRGTMDTRFIVTDFSEEIEVFYKGFAKFEFKEGETIVLTAYCPDLTNRKKVVAIDYLTKHSMEAQDWQSKSGKSRDNYGLYKRENAL